MGAPQVNQDMYPNPHHATATSGLEIYPGPGYMPEQHDQQSVQPHSRPPNDAKANDRRSEYEGYQEETMRNPYPAQGDIGDQNRLHPNRQFGHGYSHPYSNDHIPPDYHGTVSSLGPWDSASQRSIAVSSVHPEQHLRNKPSYAGGLSYIDEEGAYYRSDRQQPASEIEMRGLVHDSAPMSGRDDSRDVDFNGIKGNDYDTSSLPYPTNQQAGYRKPSGVYSWLLFPTGLDRVLAIFGVNMGKMPIEQEIERKRRGIPGQRFPVAAWGLTVSRSLPASGVTLANETVMTGVMIYELVRNKQLTGSVIATSPRFNYMIGPSSEVLINIGARFIP